MSSQRDLEQAGQCPYRLLVRSTAFHAVEPGSTPGRDAKHIKAVTVQLVTVYQTCCLISSYPDPGDEKWRDSHGWFPRRQAGTETWVQPNRRWQCENPPWS